MSNSTSLERPHSNLKPVVLPETQLVACQTHDARTSRTDHLQLGALMHAEFVEPMDLTGVAGNPLDFCDLTSSQRR
jgi:hypothetical protein